VIAAREVVERRLLAALEQAAGVALPASWRLQPASAKNLRPAASVLLRVAGLGCRRDMMKHLRGTAKTVAENRGDRPGGEQDLWPQVAEAIEQLGALSEGKQGFFALRLWESPGMPLQEVWQLQKLLPTGFEAGDAFLNELARTLLRALAKAWQDEARRREAEP
jgi:hypothetical protein